MTYEQALSPKRVLLLAAEGDYFELLDQYGLFNTNS